jgi:hypothetical protein
MKENDPGYRNIVIPGTYDSLAQLMVCQEFERGVHGSEKAGFLFLFQVWDIGRANEQAGTQMMVMSYLSKSLSEKNKTEMKNGI